MSRLYSAISGYGRVYCIAKHIAELLEFFYCGILSEEAEYIITM